ncbi:MAG TPA: DUF1344 domain-containing protein [Terriglobales bacterium]|nr:DUF1344 domain-containing protein [Terriglobales bacterium]
MAKWRFLLAACAALTIASPALAATIVLPRQQSDTHPTDPEPDAQITGRIAGVNSDTRTITLADGHHFKIPGWISFDRLQTGELVSVVYTPNPHKNTMTVKTVTVI